MARSILHPEQPLDPATERKIRLIKLLGIPLVLAFALLAYSSFLWGFVPRQIGFIAVGAEIAVAAFVIRKIRLLRNSRN
jgi:hypothetical protein